MKNNLIRFIVYTSLILPGCFMLVLMFWGFFSILFLNTEDFVTEMKDHPDMIFYPVLLFICGIASIQLFRLLYIKYHSNCDIDHLKLQSSIIGIPTIILLLFMMFKIIFDSGFIAYEQVIFSSFFIIPSILIGTHLLMNMWFKKRKAPVFKPPAVH